MSEPVTRVRPSVELDEFERRMGLGAREHDHHHEDPLAELARLVGEEHDPYRDVFAQEAAHRAPALPSSFAAIEAGLRGTNAPAPRYDNYYEPHDQHGYEGYEQPDYAPEGYAPQDYAAQGYAQQVAPSRRPLYLMAATIAVGVLGIGAAFSLKGHATSPSEVRTIMAAAGPTKIQPPADAPNDQSAQDAGILGKGNQPSPTGLANNKEEPVDVTQAVQEASRGSTDASSVPVPPPPGQADAGQVPGGDFGMGMPAPKKVKVVSVRPDGTILSDESAPSAPTTPDTSAATPVPPSAPTPAAPPVAKASTPKVTPPVKSATRIPLKTAKTDTADAAAPSDSQAPTDITPGAKSHKPKSSKTKVAMADPADNTDAAAAPAETASPKSAGGFAVQLAAPGSESEARSASSRLAKKYASALDGHHLGFHKADSNGKSVYRVRVSSLSKDDAVSLCDKVKADGGSCFVAKN